MSSSDLPDQIDVESSKKQSFSIRFFGTPAFFRLWVAQVVSATGDWLGILAFAALAADLGGTNASAAVALVMVARVLPGFFIASAAGVIVDRFDRKKIMVVCDIGRAGVLATVPFINRVSYLALAALVLELFTGLWSPAKEASVPNLVPRERLATANSQNVGAAYGTILIATPIFAFSAKIAEWGHDLHVSSVLRFDKQSIAIYLDMVTFLTSAFLISRLTLPQNARKESDSEKRIDFAQGFNELREGWRFIGISPTVRAVMVGLGAGLLGGAMVIPLGPLFSKQILHAGESGYGALTAALGYGVAFGVLNATWIQKRVPKELVFTGAVVGGAISLGAAASLGTVWTSAIGIFALGMCAGFMYVLGFTVLHESVTDELRGRIFASVAAIVRFCVLMALAFGPLLVPPLDRLSKLLFGNDRSVGGFDMFGVRLALYVAAAIIAMAGLLSLKTLRREHAVAGVDEIPTEANP